MAKETYFIIAKYPPEYPTPISVTKHEFSEEDEEFDDEFEDFKEYLDYMLQDEIDSIEQGWGRAMVLTNAEFDELQKKFIGGINK